ncbi:hypothetical protein AB0G14_22890, partial [Micromonospora sp. NPDC023814]
LHDRRRSAHPTMIQPERPRSSRPADEHLTSHEVVKHVIAVRLAEDEAAKAAAAKKLEKEKLLAVLGRKQDAVLENLTEAELLARINNL